MRGRTEDHGRVSRLAYCKETASFVAEEERHPFLLQLAEQHALNGAALPVPLVPPCPPEKGTPK